MCNQSECREQLIGLKILKCGQKIFVLAIQLCKGVHRMFKKMSEI